MTDARLRRLWLSPIGPMAAAALLGAAHLVFLARSPLLKYLTLDLATYDTWARRILSGDVLGSRVFYQDPLYPYLMALVYRVFGPDVLFVLVLQVIGNAAAVFVIHRLGTSLFSQASGAAAAWMAALYAPAIYYAGKPEKASLAALVLALAAAALLSAERRDGGAWRWWGAGALFGVCSLLRGNVLVVAGAAVVLFLVHRRIKAAALLALGVASVLAPVLIRNQVVGEDWVFTTSQAGANLFIGNNAGNVTGTYAVPSFVRPSPLYEEEDFRRFAEHTVGHALRPSEVSRFYVGRVLDWARKEPRAFLRLQFRKLLSFLDAYEYPDNWSLYFVKGFSPVLRLPLLAYGFVLPLALVGATFALRGPDAAGRRTFLVLIGAYAVSVVAFYVFSRYRFPIAFAFLVLAGHAAVRSVALARERRWGAVAGALGAAVALFFLFRIGTYRDKENDLAQRYYNLSASLLRDGRLDDAAALARTSVSISPRNGLAYLTLARVAELKGDADSDRDFLAKAYAARPDDDDVRVRMMELNARKGGYDSAASLAAAWLKQRESYQVRRSLVEIALRERRLDLAEEKLRELTELFPGDAWALERSVELAVHARDWPRAAAGAAALVKRSGGEKRWFAVLAVAYANLGAEADARPAAARAGLPWPLPPGAALEDPLAKSSASEDAALGAEVRALVERHQTREARARLERELASGRRTATIYQYLANVSYLDGDIKGARKALVEAIRLEPENPLYRSNLAALERARK
jgi:4-amino-4-deoxy-L-arabinose transferase-like glycosyltransferase/Flp pilus assembly protein TadD